MGFCCPSRFTPGERTHCVHRIGGWVDPRASLAQKEVFCPCWGWNTVAPSPQSNITASKLHRILQWKYAIIKQVTNPHYLCTTFDDKGYRLTFVVKIALFNSTRIVQTIKQSPSSGQVWLETIQFWKIKIEGSGRGRFKSGRLTVLFESYHHRC